MPLNGTAQLPLQRDQSLRIKGMEHCRADHTDFQRSKKSTSTWDYLTLQLGDDFAQGELKHHLALVAEEHLNRPQDGFSLDFLPLFTATAVQGKVDRLLPIEAAWQLVRLSAKLFDDVEDGDAKDQSANFTNLATCCLVASHMVLDKLTDFGFTAQQAQQIKSKYNLACMRACEGQQTDIILAKEQKVLTPDQWLQMTQGKSGYLFAWACWAGVMAAGGSKKEQDSFWKFGMHLGVLIQIADDYNDLWNTPDTIKLSAFYSSLPFSYAHFESENEDRKILIAIVSQALINNSSQVARLRELISELGGQKFVLAAAWVERLEAVQAVTDILTASIINKEIIEFVNRIFPALITFDHTSYDQIS
jgi:geranylgeranyl pyrophosphate synthase